MRVGSVFISSLFFGICSILKQNLPSMKICTRIPGLFQAGGSLPGRLLLPLLIPAFTLLVSCREPEPEKPYNVLMICVDDLRPELGCYGNETIRSPHIDRLAASGLVFDNHYVQCAACGPSRSMLLTSRIGTKWSPWNRYRNMEEEPGHAIAMPHLFRRNGYTTVCVGKVSHKPGGVMDSAQLEPEIPFAWDTTFAEVGKWGTPIKSFFGFADGGYHNRFVYPDSEPRIPYEAGDVGDTGYPDGLNARSAVKQLERLSEGEQPFFLAVGFYKPHLPFNAPKKYWDLYDRQAIPMADNDYPPKNLGNPWAVHTSYEVTTHYHWPDGEGNINDEQARALKHGYYACVSYTDAQIGLLLDALEESGVSDNTIVLLWGDHGWQLGEHDIFGKQTNFDIATRSPLIFRVPGMTGRGERAAGFVETLDIYPTLTELCGLEAPGDLQGSSFTSILKDPSEEGKPRVRSFFKRDSVMGKTICTDRYRLVRWKTEGGETVGLELYDHRNDPGENVNVASRYPAVTDSLESVLDRAVFFE